VGDTNIFDEDPDAIKDYTINWATYLGADTIATSTWTVPTGITKVSDTKTTTTTLVWLSGGTAGSSYSLINRITTAGGRTEDQILVIKVADVFAYCSLAEVKTAINETSTTYDVQIATAIKAARDAIDGYCKRSFTDVASSARYYTPQAGAFVIIDDAQAVSAVETDEDGNGTYERAWAATDYLLHPRNSTPKTSLRTAYNGRYTFPVHADSVKVTATWGYSAVPDSVHQFAILYAARLFLRKDVPFGVEGGSDAGTIYIPKNDPDAQMLLGPHVRSDWQVGVW